VSGWFFCVADSSACPYPWGCVSENRAGLSLTHRTQQRFDCVVERLPELLPDVEPV
jgi:hypothetical protein